MRNKSVELEVPKKTKVLVMAESENVENPRNPNKPKRVKHIKMVVISGLKKETLNENCIGNVERESIITTDDSKSHGGFKYMFNKHISQVIEPKDIGKVPPWVHIAMANAKTTFADLYHGMKPEFLQGYLNEFCYKINRRYFGENLFERLVMVCATYQSKFEHRTYAKCV